VREERRNDWRVREGGGCVFAKEEGEVEKVELGDDFVVETAYLKRCDVVDIG